MEAEGVWMVVPGRWERSRKDEEESAERSAMAVGAVIWLEELSRLIVDRSVEMSFSAVIPSPVTSKIEGLGSDI